MKKTKKNQRKIDKKKLVFLLIVLIEVFKSLKLLVIENWVIYQNFLSNYKTMLSYCLKFREKTGSKNPRIVNTKNGRIMPSSYYPICCSKKSRFIK